MPAKRCIKRKNRSRENDATTRRRNIEKGEEEMTRCETTSAPGDSRGKITKVNFQGDLRNVDRIHRSQVQPEEERNKLEQAEDWISARSKTRREPIVLRLSLLESCY